MKKIGRFLIFLCGICWIGCSDDDADFDVTIEKEMFSFTPVEGGSVMYYSLADSRVNKVKVEYTDEFGDAVYKVADYSQDTLVLDGFNRAYENVPVKVSFLDRYENESKSLNFTINTKPSVLYTFFDKVQVDSYWDGFQVVYTLEGRTEGSASVYFVGKNPTTNLQDTLFLENFPLAAGLNVKSFPLHESQQQDAYTVMITTEDNRPRVVRKEVWTGIKGMEQVMIPNANFELLDPFNKSKEQPEPTGDQWNPGGLSKAYLFDGDVKGTRAADYFKRGKATPPFTFLAGPNALNHNGSGPDVYFVLDIKEPAHVGMIKFYARIWDTYAINSDFDRDYNTKIPCDIKIYAWVGEGDYDVMENQNEPGDWKLVGSYVQDPMIILKERWYMFKDRKDVVYVSSKAELDKLEPLSLSISLPYEETQYRFFKIQFNETYRALFAPDVNHNNSNNVSIHELEVYGKK